ncbi:phosphoesterase [Novosphingobium resinovorum]|uniref:phosphoesterase n=1 Tax=Novosphingobium resinovorum TaxID=158500 RepID=UPI002ED27E7F|nr:phosphoesterase [Novosphingobium resinovorum]
MAIHFVADLHFNTEAARADGFSDSKDRIRRICEAWHARVAEDDAVWILGNVGNPVHLGGLPGRKHLVRAVADPQAWNCLATGRYASVADMAWLETPHGGLHLVSDPATAGETEDLVLHGLAAGDWRRPGFVCVAARHAGWGPVSLDEIVRQAFGLQIDRAAA